MDPTATPPEDGASASLASGTAGATDASGGAEIGPLVHDGLEILTEQQCLRLAGRRPIGRIAVSVGAVPAVFPVNFVLRGRDVYFRTSPGTKLDAAATCKMVAFEVDDFDTFTHTGWSVLIVGISTDITNQTDNELGVTIPVRAWARGERTRLVRINGDVITGRRITIAP
jgi:nitroimidazol reductase NimA-like FMN-containing flavoprotein (pyridoxamine 5'-phosphate oxidase superfamily)